MHKIKHVNTLKYNVSLPIFQGDVHYAFPSTLFGILSVMAGLLTLLLPETNKKPLPETVDEVEAMGK